MYKILVREKSNYLPTSGVVADCNGNELQFENQEQGMTEIEEIRKRNVETIEVIANQRRIILEKKYCLLNLINE